MGNRGTRNKLPVPKRAIRKKVRAGFEIGSIVTWGEGIWAHRVISVEDNAVIVDATSNGFPRYRVEFGEETLQLTSAIPDVKYERLGAYKKLK